MTKTVAPEQTLENKEALLREQVEENFRFAPAASAAGVFNAVIAVVALWSPDLAAELLVWAAAILLGTAARVLMIRRTKTRKSNSGHYERQQKRIEAIALLNGVVWGVGAGALAFVASPIEFVLLIILCSGMMGASVTTYTSQARAGMFFTIPLALGGLTALWVHPTAPTIPGTLFLGCYLILLVRGGYSRQGRFNDRIEAREQLRESAQTVKLLLNDFEAQTADWLWQVNNTGGIQKANDRFAEASGRDIKLLDDLNFVDLFEAGKERDMLTSHLSSRYSFRNLTIKLTIAGSPHWWTLSAQPSADGSMRGVASDVTAQKRAEERVSHMAHYDGLTDLANRFLFSDTLKRTIKRNKAGEQVAVLYLDLDSFKTVNDSLGHPTGDKLLCETARRIEEVIQPQDVVARLGGDEFAVLIHGQDAEARAEATAADIIEAVAKPCLIGGTQIVTSTSIGIAALRGDEIDADTLMTQADLALYAAKANGRNRAASFEAGMDEAAKSRRELETDLRTAMLNGEFELFYQPLINIKSGEKVAYEALIRWQHPTRGTVMPDDFIPLAEETGLIVQLGEWVIRTATQEVANWPEHLRVSVNLSPSQMRSANLISTVFNAVAHAGIAPNRLELEITENVLLHDSEINIATLHKLRDFGVRIALDDFGTGYSSLNYLRSFPFDKIKIDKCFVNDLADNPDCQAIIRAVTGLANSLGMETTAEGVELSEQLEHLRLEGCTEAQGFLFARPERPMEFTDLRPESKILAHDSAPILPINLLGTDDSPDTEETPAQTPPLTEKRRTRGGS